MFLHKYTCLCDSVIYTLYYTFKITGSMKHVCSELKYDYTLKKTHIMNGDPQHTLKTHNHTLKPINIGLYRGYTVDPWIYREHTVNIPCTYRYT